MKDLVASLSKPVTLLMDPFALTLATRKECLSLKNTEGSSAAVYMGNALTCPFLDCYSYSKDRFWTKTRTLPLIKM